MSIQKAICVLRCACQDIHGVVKMKEIYPSGPVEFDIRVFGLPVGLHGFHVHRTGNDLGGPECLCDHYNPEGNTHGGLNESNSHMGDLGNLTAVQDLELDLPGIGKVETHLTADRVKLSGEYSIIGRSLVVHSHQDDLGKGGYSDSLTTGHSGTRILWGIIGIDEECR